MNPIFLTYDNIVDKTSTVYQRMLDLDQYYNYHVPGWDFAKTQDLNKSLNDFADLGHEYIVVSALGNFLRMGSINADIINDCIANDSPLSAHLLQRNEYYTLDPQFFCLNLKIWDLIGRPQFEPIAGYSEFISNEIERSVEDHHDNYTPFWIKPTQYKKSYTITYPQFGSLVIRAFIEHGYKLINISSAIRQRKVYLYPNDNKQDLESWIEDHDYAPITIPLQRYAKQINQQFLDDERTVYVLNSEDVLKSTVNKIDRYVGVCGGLKAVAILRLNGFTESTQVDLIDISQPALDYQRYLVENWDGNFDNYREVSETFQKSNPTFIYAWRSWNGWESEVKSFLNSAGISKDDFYDTWQLYKKLRISYNCVDLLDTVAVIKFFNSKNSGNTYVWVSNAYNMEHTVARYGVKWLNSRANNLISCISNVADTVWLEIGNLLRRIK
jgi:hypothetical protein